MADDVTPQRAFLDRVLTGVKIAPAEIDALLDQRVEEDTHLDYKSGQITKKHTGPALLGHPKTFDGKIRKHIAGFANADGGLLIIGVNEPEKRRNANGDWERDPSKPREVDGVHGLIAERALELAVEAVKKLRPSLSVAAAFQAVEHRRGLVLLVAVPRSDSLVIAVENEQAVHYLRMHDETVHAPGYLVEDLVLGRRRRPVISATLAVAEVHHVGHSTSQIKFKVDFTNEGFVYANNPRVGLVLASRSLTASAPAAVAEAVDFRPGAAGFFLDHIPMGGEAGTPSCLAPFERLRVSKSVEMPWPAGYRHRCQAAFYFLSREQFPEWFQFDLSASIMGSGQCPAESSLNPALGARVIVASG